ncbi:DNA mismatch repair protein MLH3-like isoform X1 [Zingiber officinale]|uniref:DNA mismatch repair protein MLH3-like isoform X1 n=2 Tax=Zingiber officinale TaxID=94328 RepID=UPI001C4AFC49|nr:DNA mismatch repair protein MLH3-like isoform X1 [Zingiber officinale]XP_042384330.1 DNA mismatch repair protein MLH3-like isoform X1 [Zingiber officinale]
MNPVKRLPRSVHGPLRSSVLMFDLPRVVEELVNNSLDAGAAKVSVFVNVRTCYIKVEDDGRGISRDELVILGEKRATSKSALLDDIKVGSHGLGSEGDMMISLSDISIVEIRTKARGKPNAYCKIIKGSRCLFLGIDDQREDVGTTVVVRDLFYNQPVRRRYMQSSTQKVIHCVKKVIVRAALVHPQVSFKLIDIDREDELLNTVPASSPLPLVSSMFGDVSCSLREVGFSDDILMLTGYISRPGEVFSTKVLQYLYVNLRFVSKGPIHNLLNNLASTVMCSSALHSVDHLLQGRKKRKIQANPAFILNLHCPFSLYGIHSEPSKTIVEFKDWEKILTFFEEAARHHWQQHLAPPQQGNSFPQQNHRPRTCKAQDEETSIRDTTKGVSFMKKRSSCQIQQNSPQTQMTIPLGFNSEDTDVSQDHERSKNDLNNFFRNSESCQFEIDKIKESSPLQIFKESAENLLDSTYHNITCMDIDSYKGFSNCLLQNNVISDPVPQFVDEHDMLNSCSKYMCSKEVGNSSEAAASDATSPKFQDAKITYQQVEFSPPFCSLLSKSGTKSTNGYSLMKNMNYGSPYYSRHSESNCSIDWSRSDLSCEDIDLMISGYNIKHLNYRSTFPCEIVDVSIPSFPTVRKCQTIRHPYVSSSDLISPYSFGHDCLSSSQGFDIGLGEWAISPHYEIPGLCAWPTRSTVEEFGPKNRSPSESKLMPFEGYENWPCQKSECKDECLSLTQDSSTVLFPRERCMATKLDWNFSPSPMSKTHSFQLADDMDSENVCSFPTVAKLDWNHSQNPLRKTYSFCPKDDMVFDNICLSGKVNDDISCFSIGTLDCNYMEDKPKWDAVQKDSVKVGNLQDAQEFQSKRLPLNYMERSRSQSAPPFYRGKCKFSVLGCPTTVAVKKSSSPFSKKSIGDLSHPYASQPLLQPFASEDCLQDSIEPSSEKINIYDVRYRCPDNAINDIQEDSTSVLVKWRPGVYQTKDGGSSQKSFQQADDILDISSGLLHFTGDSLVPELIDKNCLHDARVLLQLDNKYIPVMASGNLMVIDQHAADERIRLEELRRKVLSDEGREITYLDSEEELVLPEMGFQLLHKYAEKIKAWGWIFNSQSQLPELFQKNLNHFKRNQCGVTLVAVPCILGINLTIKDLLEYIEQLVETDGSSSLPPSVLRILNSKACRGAIMFGDSLLPSECSLIVEELKATSLCFQCAHGRPTMAPLLNISALHEQLEKLKFNNGGANEAWHGLRHHPRSIHHAQMLLDSSNRFCGG